MASLNLASATLLLAGLTSAIPWPGPAPTFGVFEDLLGRSPVPTAKPDPWGKSLEFYRHDKRQDLVNTCAYLEGYYPWVCPVSSTCATDYTRALGCCPLGVQCALAHTCYPAASANLCDDACISSQNAVVCDGQYPYCGTIVNNAGDLGTFTILECVTISGASVSADITPSANYDGGYQSSFSDILATLSSELASITRSYAQATGVPDASGSIPPYLASYLSNPGAGLSLPSSILTALPSSLQGVFSSLQSASPTGPAPDVANPDSQGAGSVEGSVNGTSSSASTSSDTSSGSKTNVGAIAGGVVGGVLGLALIAGGILAFVLYRRRKQRANPAPAPNPQPPAYTDPQMQQHPPAAGGPYPPAANGAYTDPLKDKLQPAPSELSAPHNPASTTSPTVSTLTSAQSPSTNVGTMESNELQGSDVRLGHSGPVNALGQPVYEMGDGTPGQRL